MENTQVRCRSDFLKCTDSFIYELFPPPTGYLKINKNNCFMPPTDGGGSLLGKLLYDLKNGDHEQSLVLAKFSMWAKLVR